MRRIHHVGVVVRDLATAYRFYRDTLGLPLVREARLPGQGVRTRGSGRAVPRRGGLRSAHRRLRGGGGEVLGGRGGGEGRAAVEPRRPPADQRVGGGGSSGAGWRW